MGGGCQQLVEVRRCCFCVWGVAEQVVEDAVLALVAGRAGIGRV